MLVVPGVVPLSVVPPNALLVSFQRRYCMPPLGDLWARPPNKPVQPTAAREIVPFLKSFCAARSRRLTGRTLGGLTHSLSPVDTFQQLGNDMRHIDFESFRTYMEEAEGEEILEPTAEQLTNAEFWWNIGQTLMQYVDRRIEDPEPFEWYGYFLDKMIEAFEYVHHLIQQTQSTNIMMRTLLPRELAQVYANRGRHNMAQDAYDAAFLDFNAAVSYQPETEYQELRAKALSHLPSE